MHSRGRPALRVAPKRKDRAHQDDSGFTLVEVMIALGILVLMLVPFANSYITASWAPASPGR